MKTFSVLIENNGRMVASGGQRRMTAATPRPITASTPLAKTCEESGETPLWQVKAVRIVHDNVEHTVTYKDATLEFLGEPVMYFPEFSHADPTVKRQSGLLRSRYGFVLEYRLFRARIPYFIAIDADRDATLEPFLTTDGGDIMLGEYRQRWSGWRLLAAG